MIWPIIVLCHRNANQGTGSVNRLDKTQKRQARRKTPDLPKPDMNDESRRSRRNLIAVFGLWLLIVPLSLAPRKIQTLDIDLTTSKISTTTLASLVLLYFWISFLVYSHRYWREWHSDCLSFTTNLNTQIRETRQDLVDIENFLKSPNIQDLKETDGVKVDWTYKKPGKATEFHLESARKLPNSISYTLYSYRVQRRRLFAEITGRYLWDYVLPFAVAIFPAYHLITRI